MLSFPRPPRNVRESIQPEFGELLILKFISRYSVEKMIFKALANYVNKNELFMSPREKKMKMEMKRKKEKRKEKGGEVHDVGTVLPRRCHSSLAFPSSPAQESNFKLPLSIS